MRAVTFDLWDTLVVDDSDEPKRRARGLRTKAAEREHLFVEEAHRAGVPRDAAREAFARCNAWFNHQWKVEHRTPPIADRLRFGLQDLGVGETPGFAALVEAFSTMEVEIPPDPAPGIREALDALAGRYRLGIVSDAIVTPGARLRDLLRGYDLLSYFDVTVFSDEAQASKPAPRVFELATEGLGVRPADLVHVGDREANDVLGPVDFGAHAVLYTGVVDRGTSGDTRADVVCTHHDSLPRLIDEIFEETRP